MIIWIILIVYLLLLYIFINKTNAKDKKKAFLIFASLGIIFVMGSRSYKYPNVIDMQVYYNYYNSIQNIPWSEIFSFFSYNFYYGYIFLNKLFSSIFTWNQAIIYIEAIICTVSVAIFIYKNSDKPLDSMIYYLAWGIFRFNLTGFRQAIAMSICLFSIEFAKKRKLVPFLIIILLAYLVHKTAIIFLIVYFIANRKITFKNVIAVFSVCVLLFIFKNQIVSYGNNFLGTSYNEVISTSFNAIGYVIMLLLVIFLSFISNDEKREQAKIGINMTFLALVFFILSYSMVHFQRISWYFYYGALIAMPNLYPFKSAKDKTIIRAVIIIISIVLMLHRFSNEDYSNYIFFWQ